MCLDFRPSFEKLLLKSARALLRKKVKKSKQSTSVFDHDMHTVKKAQKDSK